MIVRCCFGVSNSIFGHGEGEIYHPLTKIGGPFPLIAALLCESCRGCASRCEVFSKHSCPRAIQALARPRVAIGSSANIPTPSHSGRFKVLRVVRNPAESNTAGYR